MWTPAAFTSWLILKDGNLSPQIYILWAGRVHVYDQINSLIGIRGVP
jgi:hypothetical protein